MRDLSFFRRLAVFGIHRTETVVFRCVDGKYRVYLKHSLEVFGEITEDAAYWAFFHGNPDARFTFLDSPFRKRAA